MVLLSAFLIIWQLESNKVYIKDYTAFKKGYGKTKSLIHRLYLWSNNNGVKH